MADAVRDGNFVTSVLLESSTNPGTVLTAKGDQVTGRLLVDLPGTLGTVTSVSVVPANGFAGTVATATTTPAITLSTTITGLLKGNGTAISAASDGTDYLSSTTGVKVDQTVGQTIGTTGARLTKLWVTDITVTNAISGSVTGNAATATVLQNARTIGGVSFDGTANITVATATGGFTISGGDLALGANNITMTGSLGATGARLTKGWFTDLQVTNAIAGSITGNAATVTTNANLTGVITSVGNATSIASQTGTGTKFVVDTSPTLVTPVLGVASATSINRITLTTPATGSTLTIIDGKTLTINKTISFTAADDTGVYTLPTGTKTLVASDVATLSSLTTAGATLTVTTGFQISGAASSGKILKGNGTNFVASTETYAAPGTSGNVMTSDGTNWTSAVPASSGAMTLLKAGSGTTASTSATNLDTVAISGLTANDTIIVYYTYSTITQNGGSVNLVNTTDSVTLSDPSGGSTIAAAASIGGMTIIRQEQQSSTNIFSTTIGSGTSRPTTAGGNVGNVTSPVNQYSASVSTAWTGSWTLANRTAGNLTSGGTLRWSWAVFKIAGQ